MKTWKIIGFTFVGFLLGCIMLNVKLSGIFQQWEKVSGSPNDLKTYFSATHPCDFSTSEFFFTTNPPSKIVDCSQEKMQYPEAVGRSTYVRDSSGQVWSWYHSDYMGPGGEEFCFWPILGLISGFVIGLSFTRFAKTNIANT